MEKNSTIENNIKIEEKSYGRMRFKQVEKLRKRGKLIGVDIPYLKYPLKKTKPSVIYIILSVLSSIATVALTVGICYFLFAKGFYKNLFDLFVIGGKSSSHNSWDVLGIVQIFGFMGTLILWGIGIAIIAFIVWIEAFFIQLTLKFIFMINASVQERSIGSKFKNVMIAMASIIVIPIIVILVMRYQSKSSSIDWGALIGMWAILALICGSVLGLLIAERLRAKKQFKELSNEEQQDFIEHNNALERVRRHNRRSQRINFGSKVDF